MPKHEIYKDGELIEVFETNDEGTPVEELTFWQKVKHNLKKVVRR